MKSLGVSVTEFTDELAKKALCEKFKILVGNSFDRFEIDFGNTTQCYRVAYLLAASDIDPKSSPFEFEAIVINGKKFDAHLQKQTGGVPK